LCSTATAFPFSSCDQAEAAGAAPIYAGEPGYSTKLDRDGDGVACELGGGPAVPLAATQYTTIITFSDAECVDFTVPDHNGRSQLTFCRQSPGEAAVLTHTAAPGQLIGADPVMGSASSLGCSVTRDYDKKVLIASTAYAGDGTEVNCIIDA
jgi:hypothetical protein